MLVCSLHFSPHTTWFAPLTTCRRSGSFYPQPIENYRRKSTVGLAIDFPTLNVLGFTCYAISTAAFLFSPAIQAQYAIRHPDAPTPTVRFNDFLFAAHGAVMCVIVYSQFFPQIWGFSVGKMQRVSRFIMAVWWACVFSIIVTIFLVASRIRRVSNDATDWAWIDVVGNLRQISIIRYTAMRIDMRRSTHLAMSSLLPLF